MRLLGSLGLCFRGVVHKVYPGIRVKGVLLFKFQSFQQNITWRLFSLVFLTIYITFYMLVMYVVPLTILVVLNIAIGLTIHRARLHRHSIVANGYASSNEFTRTSQDFSRTASSYNEGPGMVINGSQSRRTRYVNL